nr:toxin [Bacillus sp. B15-48]
MLIIVSTLILPGSLHANVGGIALKEFPKQSLLFESLDSNHPKLLGDIFLLPEGPFNHEEAAEIISRIDTLPETLLRKIVENRIHVVLINEKLTEHPSARTLAGVTPRGYSTDKTWDDVPGIGGSKTVLVKIGHSEKGQGHSSVNLELHELAHSIDRHVYKKIRENQDFLEIWKLERKNLFPGLPYFLHYPEEYFAETFAMYYLDGEYRKRLKNVAPETYRFIRSLE